MFQFIPEVVDEVELGALRRPVKFFHTKVGKLFLHGAALWTGRSCHVETKLDELQCLKQWFLTSLLRQTAGPLIFLPILFCLKDFQRPQDMRGSSPSQEQSPDTQPGSIWSKISLPAGAFRFPSIGNNSLFTCWRHETGRGYFMNQTVVEHFPTCFSVLNHTRDSSSFAGKTSSRVRVNP